MENIVFTQQINIKDANRRLFFARRTNLLYQFKDVLVSKKYLLGDGLRLLYISEDFEVDPDVVAVLDVSKEKLSYGKSIILHKSKGVFFVSQNSRQVINEFHKYNRLGILLSKILANYFEIKQLIPLVHGNYAYMPMRGTSHGSTDWIGVHHVEDFNQYEQQGIFETSQGKVKIVFPKGNLNDRLHDCCFLSEIFYIAIRRLVGTMNYELKPSEDTGMLQKYHLCNCLRHSSRDNVRSDLNPVIDFVKNSMLYSMVHGEIGQRDLITSYKQRINKLKHIF